MKGLREHIRVFLDLFREAFSEWSRDNVTLLAAALAYYGLFSLAPLLIIILISIDSLFHHSEQGQVIAQEVQDIASRQAPPAVGSIINQIGHQAASFKLTILSLLLLLLGAAELFVQTRTAFRIIWPLKVKKEPMLESKLRFYLMTYVLSFLLITFVAFLLLASSVITAVLLPLGRIMAEELLPFHLPVQFGLLWLVTLAISLLIVTMLFAVVYKTLFDIHLSWRDVLTGSAIASIFFAIGNFVIEVFVSYVDIGSFYGAAGSLLVFLFWIYYSAQIFLFGAEFIKVSKRKKEVLESQKV
jgi:membrane protein